jgi:hypothetical protein
MPAIGPSQRDMPDGAGAGAAAGGAGRTRRSRRDRLWAVVMMAGGVARGRAQRGLCDGTALRPRLPPPPMRLASACRSGERQCGKSG